MVNVNKLQWTENQDLKAYGLSVSSRMLQLSGRILPAPIPNYSWGTEGGAPVNGSWNLRGKRLLQPVHVRSFGLLYFPGMKTLNDDVLQRYMRTMQSGLKALGLRIPDALPAFLKANPQSDLKQAIAELMAKAGNAFQSRPNVLFILVHRGHERLYSVLKNICDVQFGVASQGMSFSPHSNIPILIIKSCLWRRRS